MLEKKNYLCRYIQKTNDMKFKFLLSTLLVASGAVNAQKYVGGDISLLPEYEKAKATYYDHEGNGIASPLAFFAGQGMNAMRLRLFVNPDKYTGSDKDVNACQDLDYVKTLGKRIKDSGMKLMLDFHYSDTWADPAKQWTPAEWASLTDEQLYLKIYDYTKSVLTAMTEAGAAPDFIQPGNEISYGMLWGAYGSSQLKKCYMGSSANWSRFTTLLANAVKACREVCPKAKVILHTERVEKPDVMVNFYDEMKNAEVDYDIIGLSYYPYFHGKLPVLETALARLEKEYPGKEIMVVEAGYPYAWAVPGTTIDYSATYPYSDDGQKAFTKDLIETLNKHKDVTGLFWWWMEYNAKGTSLSGWYNAPLFDSRTGRATGALAVMKDFVGSSANVGTIEVEETDGKAWYTLGGQCMAEPSLPGIYIHGGKKRVKTR